MGKILHILFYVCLLLLFLVPKTYPHLCDNVFRQQDKLIVKPENYNIVVKDETTFKIFLQNNMDKAIAEISLLAESPAFEFTVTPEKMSVPKNQRVFFSVTMRPTPEAKTGSYPVHFRLVGGGRQFKSFSVNVHSGVATEEVIKEDIANLLIVKPTSHILQLDGLLHEALWNMAAVASNFSSLKGGKAVCQTVGLITFDKENLYLGIHCSHDDLENLSEDDRIEIQLTTKSSGLPYYSIALSATGKASFNKILDSEQLSPWEAYNIGYAAREEEDCWSAEFSIPFLALNTKSPISQEGERYYMRINRTKTSGMAEQSYWSCDSSGYNKEEGLGEFILIP